MKNERCQNLKEFKAYIDGFQTGKGGRPPNAVEWAEIVEELNNVQLNQFNVTMPLSTPEPWTPFTNRSPIKLEDGDLGVLHTGRSTPKTFGNSR